MVNLIMKVSGYIFLSYLVFLGILYSTSNDVKTVKWSDLRNGEDWFYFVWLFFVPAIIEIIVLGLPMAYGLHKIENSTNKLIIYLLFIGLFIIEFIVANWMYGVQPSFFKISISLILFLLIFWKRIF